ncbi:hypothetical protein GGF46_000232 [Coemansia sp. RSA 552]|nr:hypothetical protein GGF46_000232 [Coemansia sp. RSA 552]
MQRAQARQRQPRAALSDANRDQLKTQLNKTYAEDILSIARHFGGQSLADRAQVVDIDSNGITIEWEWPADAQGSGKRQTEDMQFAFRDFSGPGSVVQEVSDLAAEASQALGQTKQPRLVRDKEALDAKTLVSFEFVMPSPAVAVPVLTSIAVLIHLALAQTVHPALQFLTAVCSQRTYYFIFVACLVIHIFEACAVWAVCQLIKTFQPRQMSTATQLKWTAGGLTLGAFCLHSFMRSLLRQFALAESMPGPRPARRAA